MKTKIFFISAFAFVCVLTSQAQEKDRKVQMRIIENGKVVTDTTFSVADEVDKKDIDRVSKMMNPDDVFIFREKPSGKNFSYSFRFDGLNDSEIDSLFENDIKFNHNSVFENMTRHFNENREFFFKGDEPMRYRYFYEEPGHPRHRIIEKDIIIGDEKEAENHDYNGNIIVEEKAPGKKQIIIRDDEDGDVKTIRKKIDNDTEIIIIKKGKKDKEK